MERTCPPMSEKSTIAEAVWAGITLDDYVLGKSIVTAVRQSDEVSGDLSQTEKPAKGCMRQRSLGTSALDALAITTPRIPFKA
ncbi:hypothetical protein TNCV_484031 [Trichonephila clavipes]|nr:hypothetical protein TNCV_484031 [Trichonephila clavipes]